MTECARNSSTDPTLLEPTVDGLKSGAQTAALTLHETRMLSDYWIPTRIHDDMS